MSAPLSNRQKAELAMLYHAAWRRSPRRGQITAEEFRRAEVIAAVGLAGLRCCDQSNYGDVKAHGLALLAREGQALKAAVRQAGNPQRIIEWKLLREMETLGKPMTYANSISKRMFHGTPLDQLSTDQLWKVFYAVRKERSRRYRKTNQAAA